MIPFLLIVLIHLVIVLIVKDLNEPPRINYMSDIEKDLLAKVNKRLDEQSYYSAGMFDAIYRFKKSSNTEGKKDVQT